MKANPLKLKQSRQALGRKLQAKVEKDFASAETKAVNVTSKRQAFLDDIRANGGKGFVERVQRYGRTEKGEEIKFNRWYLEYSELIGDFRVHHTLTTGCAQLGKTLGHVLLLTDSVVHGKLNSAYLFATRTSLEQNVPTQFQPVIDYWMRRLQTDGTRLQTRGDKQITTLYQVEKVNTIFSYVSSTNISSSERKGKAAAGGSVVSFQADIMMLEERSQFPQGAADPLPRRLDASCVFSKPQRDLGTPGAGSGIESEIATADYHFYPHFHCTNCDRASALDPKGCLLKKVMRRNALGQEEEGFLSETGRPLKWWCKDAGDAINTAFFACPHCGTEITEQQRQDSWYQCLTTGITLRESLDNMDQNSNNCE